VWAHHILGLNVSLYDESGKAVERFGTGRENIVILVEDSMDHDVDLEICLLDIDKDVAIPLAKTLYAFLHVDHIDNVDVLHNLPLSAKAVEDLRVDSSHDDRRPFRYMTQLLARNVDTSNAILVSSRSWSVYTNILVLRDPTEVSDTVVHVSHGVPSRGGERKQCIRDAVVPVSTSDA
jgi:hypothetical protein